MRRAIRVGTCLAPGETFALGELVVVTEAIAEGGSAAALGVARGESVLPDPGLTERLGGELGGQAHRAAVSSFDVHPEEQASSGVAADMQSAPLLARARALGIEAAAVLIVTETTGGGDLAKGGGRTSREARRAGGLRRTLNLKLEG